MAGEVEQQFRQLLKWNQLTYATLAEETFESRAILDLEGDISGKRGLIAMTIVRTAPHFCLMFRGFESYDQFAHLTLVVGLGTDVIQGAATLLARGERMHGNMLWVGWVAQVLLPPRGART